jgi:hypothetical protein
VIRFSLRRADRRAGASAAGGLTAFGLIGAGVTVLGIGFVALLTGAAAHRFLLVSDQEAESATAKEQAEILAELRAVSTRLEKLEQAVLAQNLRSDG